MLGDILTALLAVYAIIVAAAVVALWRAVASTPNPTTEPAHTEEEFEETCSRR